MDQHPHKAKKCLKCKKELKLAKLAKLMTTLFEDARKVLDEINQVKLFLQQATSLLHCQIGCLIVSVTAAVVVVVPSAVADELLW